MKRKIFCAVGGYVAVALAAVLAQIAPPRASAAPGDPAPATPTVVRVSSRPSVFTLRYVAFVARPKTKDVAARYKNFPPVLAHNLSEDSRYSMTTTPEGFARLLQTAQPDHDFKIGLEGSIVLYNSDSTPAQIIDGPNLSDPYGLTLVDSITISQNSDTTLDFVSKGTFSDHRLGSGEWAGTTGWDGENKEMMIGRTYQWGVTRRSDGTCVTWALCILPGRLDQVASAWKRHDGARATVLASGKAAGRRVRQ